MLITISGMVGSGKSTTASTIVDLLTQAGQEPRYLRFRYLGLFGFGNPRSARPAEENVERRSASPRGHGFTLRRLTAARTLGYIVRAVAFRFSGIGGASRCDVVDRYFYDNLIQYRLTAPVEKFYVRILRSLIPTPDLAIVTVASEDTLAGRRPNYAREYLVRAGHQYGQLPTLFPGLTAIRTDPGVPADDEIRRAVNRLVGRTPQAAARASAS